MRSNLVSGGGLVLTGLFAARRARAGRIS